ncbi:MAG: serine/threonine-protein kinase, partial [Phycisphaerales bacterium]|nr:serine/threonine-protein kinase [Phycisphaerales bacterium]
MTDQPPNPAGPEDTTRRDSEAMLGGKSSRDPLIGTTVDQYSIKRVIGEGGMGVVYEALQQSPRRTVALKMMKRGVTSKSAMRRFEYEAQTLGRLRHDGIAQIYQAGTWDDGTGGRPWFAMEYIQGAKTLTQYCKDKKLGTRERLDIFSKVCAAVQHGHAKGIIHRDLKPGNILVTSSGVPKVIDFGVARSTDSDMAVTTLQTDVGALIGTLQYMSPEQCDADPNDIDIRS